MDSFRIFRNDCMVKYCCDFGSAIVFRKEQDWDKVVIDLVFANAWNLSSTILK
jgi:hypothetical protein